MPIVGGFVVLCGCGFVAAGLAQLALTLAQAWTMFAHSRRPVPPAPADPNAAARPNTVGIQLDQLARVIDALAKLPLFALAPFVGIILIAIGQRLVAGDEVLRY